MYTKKRYATILSLSLLCFFGYRQRAKAQIVQDHLVQINGVLMTSDSLYAIPDALITVKHYNKGMYTSEQGVFSIVCFKGDTLQFRSLGFRDKDYVVPLNLEGNQLSIIQLMSQDTFFLNETVVHALPSRERFDYVFQHLDLEDDAVERARKNSDLATFRAMSVIMRKDGSEGQAYAQRDAAYRAAYSGQQQPMNIFSPIKWGQFIEAWKRGDFRKKK